MLIIDGQRSELSVQNFSNLEELLVKVVDEDHFKNRVVTDVMVNDEAFSEIYPHQAEDIAADELSKVEIVSIPANEMAIEITREMYKVIHLIEKGSRRVADLFRQADDSEALETYQDLLEVTQNFMNMIRLLRDQFALSQTKPIDEATVELNSLFVEVIEVQENEDWILLADLLEYEMIPAVDKWKKIIADIRTVVKNDGKANA